MRILGRKVDFGFCVIPGGSLPVTEQILALECTDGPNRVRLKSWLTCCRFCPANATTHTWCLKTAALPAPNLESVSGCTQTWTDSRNNYHNCILT